MRGKDTESVPMRETEVNLSERKTKTLNLLPKTQEEKLIAVNIKTTAHKTNIWLKLPLLVDADFGETR